ncbi:MAG: DUF2304 domain-containing protein [Anaerolineae bacterium]
MMAPLPRLLVFLLGLVVLLFVINLVRKRHLQERYAILWLIAGVVLTLSPIFIGWLDHLAFSMGFEYPPALLLLLAVVGLLLLIFQLSLTISRSEDRVKVLTQELAILRQRVNALEEKLSIPTFQETNSADHD